MVSENDSTKGQNMSIPGADERQQRLQEIDKQYPHSYRIIAGIVLVSIAAAVGAAVVADRDGYITNLFTELLSIGVTIFVLDTLAAIRADKQLKAQLIREMGSTDNGIATRAMNELTARDWLTDGSLQGADLRGANLQEANLREANLQEADLWKANLQETRLGEANLQEARLGEVNLQEALLVGTNLQEAFLRGANLYKANLVGANLHKAGLREANLHKANLWGANLQEAFLLGAEFNEDTVLPDGNNWTSETDMERFTDPNHPSFWRSNVPSSPAYRGDSG